MGFNSGFKGLISSSLSVATAVSWRFVYQIPPLTTRIFVLFIYKSLPPYYYRKMSGVWIPSKYIFDFVVHSFTCGTFRDEKYGIFWNVWNQVSWPARSTNRCLNGYCIHVSGKVVTLRRFCKCCHCDTCYLPCSWAPVQGAALIQKQRNLV